jgi:hypothetical protein
MASHREKVLSALFGRLQGVPDATVRRNEALPASVPAGGLVILRDGDLRGAVSLVYGFSMAEGWSLTFELFRVFLPKPKYAVSGPGGFEASFDWRAA